MSSEEAPTSRRGLDGLLDVAKQVGLVASVAGLVVAGALWLADAEAPARWLLAAVVVVVLVPLTVEVGRGLARREAGVDVVAWLAMAGALALGELLAGAVIALMLTGGEALERRAGSRAGRELTRLLARAPRSATVVVDDAARRVDVDEVGPGDRVLVATGEVVPVDGTLLEDASVDESALTGEPLPVTRHRGDRVASGAVNAGGAFQLTAVADAAASTYAGIVELVRSAQASRAPFVRLADRVAWWFVPLTLVLAGGAWAVTGDPVRALAVLVVATPCPLILATPIAITSGVSRAARAGVIVKGGGALEALAAMRTTMVDKTGTLTGGSPQVVEMVGLGGLDADEALRLAACLEQASGHVLADAVVAVATRRDLPLSVPTQVDERPGLGLEGVVEGRRVRVGSLRWALAGSTVPEEVGPLRRRAALEGSSLVGVAVDGRPAGALLLDDPIRPEAPRAVRALRSAGVERVVMLTGDRAEVADLVGAAVGVDAVLADRDPQEKVEAVREECARAPTMMVGDGVNDAPALAAADLGVAIGARGATASSEAADAVLVVDRLDRVASARRTALRSRRIARQSAVGGMALAAVAMAAAAAGWLVPVVGAIVQEVIDLGSIGNALRALRSGERRERRAAEAAARATEPYLDEHRHLHGDIDRLRQVADRLDASAGAQEVAELRRLRRFLEVELLPHELAEEAEAYPALARATHPEDPTAAMADAHREIVRLARMLGRVIDVVDDGGPDAEDRRELRRLLYGLHAILRMHNAQEEDLYREVAERARRLEADRDRGPAAAGRREAAGGR